MVTKKRFPKHCYCVILSVMGSFLSRSDLRLAFFLPFCRWPVYLQPKLVQGKNSSSGHAAIFTAKTCIGPGRTRSPHVMHHQYNDTKRYNDTSPDLQISRSQMLISELEKDANASLSEFRNQMSCTCDNM